MNDDGQLLIGFLFGVLICFVAMVLFIHGAGFFIRRSVLEANGYIVHEYSAAKDGVETNWVEVVRTDGRPL